MPGRQVAKPGTAPPPTRARPTPAVVRVGDALSALTMRSGALVRPTRTPERHSNSSCRKIAPRLPLCLPPSFRDECGSVRRKTVCFLLCGPYSPDPQRNPTASGWRIHEATLMQVRHTICERRRRQQRRRHKNTFPCKLQ